MCYNLFGTHSGPGPKADRAFLEQMVARMSNIPAKDRASPWRWAALTGPAAR